MPTTCPVSGRRSGEELFFWSEARLCQARAPPVPIIETASMKINDELATCSGPEAYDIVALHRTPSPICSPTRASRIPPMPMRDLPQSGMVMTLRIKLLPSFQNFLPYLYIFQFPLDNDRY